MRQKVRYIFLLLTITISFFTNTFAAENLSDNQLGDVIAAEGVCNIKIEDGCNASQTLKLVLSSNKLKRDVPEFKYQVNENTPGVVVPQDSIITQPSRLDTFEPVQWQGPTETVSLTPSMRHHYSDAFETRVTTYTSLIIE